MIKSNKGFTAVDTSVAVIAFALFSIIIVSLLYINSLTNLKLRIGALGMIYLTETFENIGMADYSEVIDENMENFIPEDMNSDIFGIEFTVTTINPETDILKKVEAEIKYKVGNKEYSLKMERMKAK